ncbi:hypothetical protein FXF50_04215 [Micromonospora sp. AP08]|uniref:hypothetical protein n=1 Tax=Micromonospora sp. AP08 TaxID=2604467 RepID=UPI0011D69211|nr:hypothetical protein [Micromonospora sp. AP08]TYB39598.1 hypothetical protein FXF50_04215 [Micromonospora sp. AP08]
MVTRRQGREKLHFLNPVPASTSRPPRRRPGTRSPGREIAERGNGVTSLTVTGELEGAPQTLAQVAGEVEGAGGGWAEILSDLKSLLETGSPLYA